MQGLPRPAILFSLLFFILGLLGISHHEMWRDELQTWLIARDSTSLFALMENMSTEEHPALWYIIVYFIEALTGNPFFMQLFTLLIGTAIVFLIFKYAPFNTLQKVLFSFSYFILFEYTIISRGYGIGILLILIYCILYAQRHKYYVQLSVVLFLLANTTIYGTIISANLGLLLIMDYVFRRTKNNVNYIFTIKTFVGLLIFLSGIGIGLGHVIFQSTQEGYFTGAMLGTESVKNFNWLAKNLTIVFNAYIPIPNIFDAYFWNSNILQLLPYQPRVWIGLIFSIILYLLPIFMFLRKPVLLIFYLLSSITMFVLIAFLYYGHLMHHGHFFMLFIICLWLSNYMADSSWLNKLATQGKVRIAVLVNSGCVFLYKFKLKLLTFFLTIQVVAGACAYTLDWKLPFSNARQVGMYLSKNEFSNLPIIGSPDYAISPITNYLNRKIFFPESQTFGSFVKWTTSRHQFDNPTNALKACVDAGILIIKNGQKNTLIIMSHSAIIPDPIFNKTTISNIGQMIKVEKDLELKLIYNVKGAVILDENYYVFLLSKKD